MGDTKIEYVSKSWSPIRGCSRVSPGCAHCWAVRMANRQKSMPGYEGFVDEHGWTGKVSLIESQLDVPLHWRKPQRVATAFMGDLFHENLPVSDVARVFCVMDEAEDHDFLLLTKRASRLPDVITQIRDTVAENHERWDGGRFTWPLPNIWLGVSVEDQAAADERIPWLLKTPAAVRWVSLEPMIGPVTFRPEWLSHHWSPATGALHLPLDWVVLGGESGPGARPCAISWIRDVVGQCKAASVSVFMKQLGRQPVDAMYETGMRRLGNSKGADPEEWPADLRVQQFPEVKS